MTLNPPNSVATGLEQELEPLWRFTLYLTRDNHDAEDLFQRACLRALEQRDKYQPTGQLRSWLFRLTQNVWYNELRSRTIRDRRAFVSGDLAGQEAENVEGSQPDSSLLFNQVFNAVEALPEAQRLVVILVCVEGFSYREAAEVLDIPTGTVMSRLARARYTLGNQFLGTETQQPGEKSGNTRSQVTQP